MVCDVGIVLCLKWCEFGGGGVVGVIVCWDVIGLGCVVGVVGLGCDICGIDWGLCVMEVVGGLVVGRGRFGVLGVVC